MKNNDKAEALAAAKIQSEKTNGKVNAEMAERAKARAGKPLTLPATGLRRSTTSTTTSAAMSLTSPSTGGTSAYAKSTEQLQIVESAGQSTCAFYVMRA